MKVFDYLDYRRFIRDSVESLQQENPHLSVRELLRRVRCSSPSYYKEVIVDAKKRMSLATARRFAEFFRLPTEETDYFLLLVQYNQAKSELERIRFYEQLLQVMPKSSVEDHFLSINEYGYLSDWHNSVVRELLPLAEAFANRDTGEREALARLLRVRISEGQIDIAIKLLESLKFIRRDKQGNYVKSAVAIKNGDKTPAAFRTLCQFTDLGKSVINTTDPLYRLFKIAVLSMNEENFAVIEKKINDVCSEIVALSGTSQTPPDRLYALNIQFFPLTRLPGESKAG